MFEYVREYLKINEVEYEENFKLEKISPVKIGGKARLVAYPDSEQKIISLISFLVKTGCKHKILGKMSNVLPPDNEYSGVIIRTDRLCSVRFDKECVYAESGATLPSISRMTAGRGVSGFEELSGIPGSVGGAVVGNAGAFGREISDLFVCARCWFPDSGTIAELSPECMNFAYRRSNLKMLNCLVLSCKFKGIFEETDVIRNRLIAYRRERNEHQPVGKPSLGSTFKRPSAGVSAGALIDACGLKGFTVGGASISTKHAGFIINSKGARAKDYLDVAAEAQRAVYTRFQVKLEKEIEIID